MTRRSSPIIVGRDRELAEIAAARERAATGLPQIVVVRGEAGIGKSRLVEEAIARARAAGEAVLHGACVDFDGDGVPYLPVIAAMRSLSRSMGATDFEALVGPHAEDLSALIPDRRVSASAAATSAATSTSGADRARLFERFLELLGRLAERAPILAVVEDVQWVDPATRDLVTFLVRNVAKERIVAIVTCRTDDLPAGHPVAGWLAEVGRVSGATRLELGRLDPADVARQIEAIAGEPIDPAVVERVARRSEGHPLFAEELLAADASDVPPPSLVDILLARVLTLDPLTLAVVRTAAVAGRSLDERLLARILDRSDTDVGEALRLAAAHGVLVPQPDGTRVFRHDLLREVVERELSDGERRALHERIARTLEAEVGGTDRGLPADAAAELARHWFAAERPSEAYRASFAAAAAAEKVDAFADAHRLLERAIALEGRLPIDERPGTADRIGHRRRAATAADLAGDVPRAIELIREAIELTDGETSPTTIGLLRARLGFLMWASGRGDAALLEHERAVDLVPADPPTSERANVLGGLAGALMGLGRFAESRPVAEAAIACAVAAGSSSEECRGRMTLGSDLVALGEIDAGIDELTRAHELAATDRTELLVVTGHNLALNLLAADRLDDALGAAVRTHQATRDGGLERRYGLDLAALVADVLFRLGRWTEADEVTRAGLALDRRGRGSPYLAIVRARLAANQGDVDEARDRLAGITIADLDPDVAVIHAVASVETALSGGDPATAADLAAGALAAFSGTGTEMWSVPLLAHGLRALADEAETARATRDVAMARAAAGRADGLAASEAAFAGSAVGGTATMRAWLATARAERARLDGAADPGPWAAAADAWDVAAGRLGAAYARFRLAETELRRSGVKADVAGTLGAAWRVAVELGARPLRDAIETLARRARIALADTAPATPPSDTEVDPGMTAAAGSPTRSRSAADGGHAGHGLSAREIEVLRLVAAGRSNGEIGDELFITRKTAGVHVTHILDKLGVSNRVEAAMAAARLGLIDDVLAQGDASEDAGDRAGASKTRTA